MKRIAIIGGGAKAAALCAKATCVNLEEKRIELSVFERDRFGAAWNGSFGYTDGEQTLCTPAERDVGFPYQEGVLDEDGVGELFARFSWASFLIQRGDNQYRDWVDRGRRKPSHRLYADYLRWVIRRSDAKQKKGAVTHLFRKDSKWSVRYSGRAAAVEVHNFDGLVVTGSGPAKLGFARPDDPRIIDGVDFWRDPKRFLDQRRVDEAEPVVIAGSGGTAAAIAAWITRHYPDQSTLIVGKQAALFTRSESFFENALFSDEETWLALETEEQVAASERLNRGVVWASVADTLSGASNVRFRPGRVVRAFISAPVVDGAQDELRLEVKNAEGVGDDAASLIVDAAGFDPWWFVDLLPARMRALTEAAGKVTLQARRAQLQATMIRDLSMEFSPGRIHAPMLSQSEGPGFASLMVLGAMSDRILEPYLDR